MKIIIISDMLKDILSQEFAQSPCSKDRGIDNEEDDTRLLQKQGPEAVERQDPSHETYGATRHGDAVLTIHNPSMSSRQPGELIVDASPEATPLLENVARSVSSLGSSLPYVNIYIPIMKLQIDRSLVGTLGSQLVRYLIQSYTWVPLIATPFGCPTT